MRKTQTKRARRHPERDTQITIAQYLDAVLDPCLCVWTAIGHGGGGKVRGAWLKRMGMKAGIPDIAIWWTTSHRDHLHCAFLEIKSADGRSSDAQDEMADRLSDVGAHVEICRSIDDVERVIFDCGIPLRRGVRLMERKAA
jgi:hypothetical protein